MFLEDVTNQPIKLTKLTKPTNQLIMNRTQDILIKNITIDSQYIDVTGRVLNYYGQKSFISKQTSKEFSIINFLLMDGQKNTPSKFNPEKMVPCITLEAQDDTGTINQIYITLWGNLCDQFLLKKNIKRTIFYFKSKNLNNHKKYNNTIFYDMYLQQISKSIPNSMDLYKLHQQ